MTWCCICRGAGKFSFGWCGRKTRKWNEWYMIPRKQDRISEGVKNNRKRVSELLMSFWRYRQTACGICFLAYPTTLLVGKTPNDETKRKPGKCIAGQDELMKCQRCRQRCLEFARSHSHTQILKKDTNQVNKSEYENVHNRSCVFGPWTAYLHSNFECGPCG